MNPSNTLSSISINPEQLTDTQKDERTRLASSVGLAGFTVPAVIGLVIFLTVSTVWGGSLILERLKAQQVSQSIYFSFVAIGIFCLGVVIVGGTIFAVWASTKAYRNYKQLRELCGNTWPTSVWRKVMWSSWLAEFFSICTVGALFTIWIFSRSGGFVALVLDLMDVYIFAALAIPAAVLLFCLWRVERLLERDLLHWATLTSLKHIRDSWSGVIVTQGVTLVSFFFESSKSKTAESFVNRLALVAIASIIPLCGIWLTQRRSSRLRTAGKEMDSTPEKKPTAPRDLNRTDDIWDAATLAEMHALSPSDAEKEANSNLTSATGCALTVWLALGLTTLTLVACAILGLKAFQANWDTLIPIAKTFGLVVVTGAIIKKPATHLFSLYQTLRMRTQKDWHSLWRIRLVSYVTSHLTLVLIFAFAALQLPFGAFALPAVLLAIGTALDIHGIQTVNRWSTYRLQKQNWKDIWLSPILFVIAIPLLARLCSLNTYTAESLIEGWGALRQTLLQNPFWVLPDVWLMVIITIWTPIEVWFYLRQLRVAPNASTT